MIRFAPCSRLIFKADFKHLGTLQHYVSYAWHALQMHIWHDDPESPLGSTTMLGHLDMKALL